MTADAPIGRSAGYEIVQRGDEVILAHRATRGPALVAWIVGGMAVLAGVHAVLWPGLAIAGEVGSGGWIAAGVLVPVTAALFIAARAGYRAYRRRRDRPIDEVPSYRADLSAGVMRSGGRDVARLADIQIDAPRNHGDSTQGSMRWVRLRWSGGSARVYNAGADEAERVAAALRSLFAGSGGHDVNRV